LIILIIFDEEYGLQITKPFIMQFSPTSHHFISLQSKYSPTQHFSNIISRCSSLTSEAKFHTHTTTCKINFETLGDGTSSLLHNLCTFRENRRT
jgi:hypothetical protein